MLNDLLISIEWRPGMGNIAYTQSLFFLAYWQQTSIQSCLLSAVVVYFSLYYIKLLAKCQIILENSPKGKFNLNIPRSLHFCSDCAIVLFWCQ